MYEVTKTIRIGRDESSWTVSFAKEGFKLNKRGEWTTGHRTYYHKLEGALRRVNDLMLSEHMGGMKEIMTIGQMEKDIRKINAEFDELVRTALTPTFEVEK